MQMMFERYEFTTNEQSQLYFIISKALQLATLANEIAQNKDWWWLVQLSKCYNR